MHTRPPKLMDQIKANMRVKRYSPRTEKTYCYWIRFFIRFHGVRHPVSMGESEVHAFLEHLAIQGHVGSYSKPGTECPRLSLSLCAGQRVCGCSWLSGMNRPGRSHATATYPARCNDNSAIFPR